MPNVHHLLLYLLSYHTVSSQISQTEFRRVRESSRGIWLVADHEWDSISLNCQSFNWKAKALIERYYFKEHGREKSILDTIIKCYRNIIKLWRSHLTFHNIICISILEMKFSSIINFSYFKYHVLGGKSFWLSFFYGMMIKELNIIPILGIWLRVRL